MNNAIQAYLAKHGFGHFCPKAVLFDMDGVLYDSMPNHAASWHQAMSDYGLDMAPSDAYRYEGMRGVETIQLLTRKQWNRQVDDEEARRMYAHKSQLYSECPPARIMPGVKDLMQQIKDCGLTIGIVTGSGQRVLLDKLESDFQGLVDPSLIVTAFDVTHGKPHPEPYLKGMEKCKVLPHETIVVENAPLGVRAAVAAHCLTIAVNTGPLDHALLLQEGAVMVYPDMPTFSNQWQSLFREF